MALSKFLKIIFGILLVVIVGELIILFFRSRLRYEVLNNNKKAPENKPQIAKTGQPLHQTINVSSPEYKKMLTTITPAIHPTVLNLLEKMSKSENDGGLYILQESKHKVLQVEPKGACVEDRRNEVLYPGEICFPFAIKVESTILPQRYHWFYFTEKNIAKTKVFIKNKKNSIPLSLEQIKPGDIILKIEKWDPSIPFDINELKKYIDKQLVEQTIYIINRNL